jgi:hypothetical protein
MREEAGEGEEAEEYWEDRLGGGGGQATLSDISLTVPLSHTATAGGQRRSGNTPGCDPAATAWRRVALAMTCGVRPTRGGVEPKERWM